MRSLLSALLAKLDGGRGVSSQKFRCRKRRQEKGIRGKEKGRSMALRPKASCGFGDYSVGLVMRAQAMRGGAALLASVATAWITIAVPPLLKTEWLSEPSVTLGATTVA